MHALFIILISTLLAVFGCVSDSSSPSYPDVDRKEKIPVDITKRSPDTDQYPPILHSDEYEEPIPLPYPVNTAGAEDSPFILPDGNTLYFFFTPDVRMPVEQQLVDDVTGVWVSFRGSDSWTEPQRVWLQDPGKLSLDGAVSIQGDEMWFASAREGYTGVNMFVAEMVNGEWTNWRYCGDRLMKEIQIGEVHLHGEELYFHSDRLGGKGSYDIWVTTRDGDFWLDPVSIDAVNTDSMDGFPFVTSNGDELWFTRTYMGTPGIFRSVRINGGWGEPELMVSQFAGEPTVDDGGNLYFVHHYYENGIMIEADIYVTHKRQ